MGCVSSNARTAVESFPTLWGTPWYAFNQYSDKQTQIQWLRDAIVLTLPERDATVWDRMQALGLEFLG